MAGMALKILYRTVLYQNLSSDGRPGRQTRSAKGLEDGCERQVASQCSLARGAYASDLKPNIAIKHQHCKHSIVSGASFPRPASHLENTTSTFVPLIPHLHAQSFPWSAISHVRTVEESSASRNSAATPQCHTLSWRSGAASQRRTLALVLGFSISLALYSKILPRCSGSGAPQRPPDETGHKGSSGKS
jgi:hypothetical protein